MTRQEFLALRNDPNKRVSGDISWQNPRDAKPNKVFKVSVANSLGYDVSLIGRYNTKLTTVVYTFIVAGIGPICRLCIRGQVHKPAGKTHKHDLQTEDGPDDNLPDPEARPDLERKSAREAWTFLCAAANIEHRGLFVDP